MFSIVKAVKAYVTRLRIGTEEVPTNETRRDEEAEDGAVADDEDDVQRFGNKMCQLGIRFNRVQASEVNFYANLKCLW